MGKSNTIIFGLSSRQDLAKKAAQVANVKYEQIKTKRFADGEIFADYENTVRGMNVYIIQSTSPPVNENLMELLIFIDALKRGSANSINVFMPYYGYGRQDRKNHKKQPISAKLVADLLEASGAKKIISFEPHSEQLAGFFNIPFDGLKGTGFLAKEIKKMKIKDLTIVSPDQGGVVRARLFAKKLSNAPLAIIDKRRTKPNEVTAINVLGDVKDRNVIIFDDMIDTGGTIAEAVKILKTNGAKDIYVAAFHGVFSKKDGVNAVDRIIDSGVKKIFVTDSIEQQERKDLFVLQIAKQVGEIILRDINHKSISEYIDTN